MPHQTLNNFWDLLWTMTEKELKARYKNTIFGFLWLVINPLVQMIVIGSIFVLFVRDPVENYYFHLFAGLITWNFFSLSLTKATPSIMNERLLIKKSPFPRSVIPLSIILSNLINYMVAFVLFLMPASQLGHINAQSLLFIILGLVLLSSFTIGFSLLATALNVRYRDVNFFIQALLIVWFYATPIVYSLSQIPKNLAWIWNLNPLTSVVQLLQSAIINSPPPQPDTLLSNALVILMTTWLGITVFQKESKNFDDWV